MFTHIVEHNCLIQRENNKIRFIPKDIVQNIITPSSNKTHLTIDDTLLQILEPQLNLDTCCGISFSGINVSGNRLYRLILDINILWNTQDELAPVVSVHLQSIPKTLNWKYTIPHSITRNKPRLEALIFIPNHVEMVQIDLIVEVGEEMKKDNEVISTYQLDIYTSQCLFEMYSNEQVQTSQNMFRPLKLAQQSIHGLASPSSSAFVYNSLNNLVEHTYLLHLSTTPLYYTCSLQQQLSNYGVSTELLMLPENNNNNATTFPHSPIICSGCAYRSLSITATTISNNNKIDAVVISKLLDQASKLLIQCLKKAIVQRRQSIMIITDDCMIHQDFLNQIDIHVQHLSTNNSSWNFILLGANQLEKKTNKTDDEKRKELDNYFYPVSEENIHSSFAIIIRGQTTILSVLQYLQKALALNKEALISLNLYAMRSNNNNGNVSSNALIWYPNLIIPHPSISIIQNNFIQQHQSYLCNYQPKNALYWNQKRDYIDATIKSTTKSPLGIQQKQVHILLPMDVVFENTLKVLTRLKEIRQGLENQSYPYWTLHIVFFTTSTDPASKEVSFIQQIMQQNISNTQFHTILKQKNNSIHMNQLQMKLNEIQNTDWLTWHDLDSISCPHRFEAQIKSCLWDERSQSSQSIRSSTKSNKTVFFSESFVTGLRSTSSNCNDSNHCLEYENTLFGTVFGWKCELAKLTSIKTSISIWNNIPKDLCQQMNKEQIYCLPAILQCKL